MLAPPRSPRRTSWNPGGTLPQGRPGPPRSLPGLRPQGFQLLGKKKTEGQNNKTNNEPRKRGAVLPMSCSPFGSKIARPAKEQRIKSSQAAACDVAGAWERSLFSGADLVLAFLVNEDTSQKDCVLGWLERPSTFSGRPSLRLASFQGGPLTTRFWVDFVKDVP